MSSHKKTNEFLLATRYGDYEQVNNLVNLFGDTLTNSQDHFGTSALHLAVMYGHTDIVKLLLSQPNINANRQVAEKSDADNQCPDSNGSYRGYSPLDMAIKYKQPIEIVELLLEAGASTNHPEEILTDLLGDIEENEVFNSEPVKNAMAIFELILKKIPDAFYIEGFPISIILQVVNTAVDEPEAKIAIQKIIDMILEKDTNHYADLIVAAKDFTNAFPSSNSYSTINQFSTDSLEAEGHLTPFAVKSFHDAMIDYRHVLNTDYYMEQSMQEFKKIENNPLQMDLANYTNLKNHIFSEISDSVYFAKESVLNAGLYDTSKMLYQLYDEGKTILLPTEWKGHGVDIILDKSLGLYMVANAGGRHYNLAGGVNAYKNHSPITVDDIYQILNNEKQYNLEYENYYKLGLEKNNDFSQTFEDQAYGNCALNSLLLANWSLTYLNLYKNISNPILAKEIADIWQQDMVEHHKTFTLKNYLSAPYFSDDTPLYDALKTYETKIDHIEKIEQTTLMLDYLTSPEHIIDFETFYHDNQLTISSDLKNFMLDNGYDSVIKEQDILSPDALVLDRLDKITTSFDDSFCYSQKNPPIEIIQEDTAPTSFINHENQLFSNSTTQIELFA